MHKIIFECETITPMFLAGADGKTPELRAPSIKGALRFWWRAMHGHLELGELRKKEAEIFGGVGEKEGKSKLIIQVQEKSINLGTYTPLPHHTGRDNCIPCNDIGYKKCKKAFRLPCIMPESEFNVIISFIETNEINYKYLESLLLVFAYLGALGKRSRRGFGALNIKTINKNPVSNIIDLNFVLEHLNNIVPNRFKLENDVIKLTEKNNYYLNYPFIKQIKLGKKYNNWKTLLKDIGFATHKYNNPPKDCSLGKVSRQDRFASPIFVSIIKINSNYYPIMTTLYGAPKFKNCNVNEKKQRDFINEFC